MKKTKILALCLSASMLVSMAACSSISKDYSKHIKILEEVADDIGAEKIKELDSIEDSVEYEDGCYVSSSNKDDIESFCESFDSMDEKDIEEMTAFVHMSEDDSLLLEVIFDMTDEKAAQDSLEQIAEDFDSMVDTSIVETELDDDTYLFAYDTDDIIVYYSVIADGDTLIIFELMTTSEEKDEYLEIFENFIDVGDYPDPRDLL